MRTPRGGDDRRPGRDANPNLGPAVLLSGRGVAWRRGSDDVKRAGGRRDARVSTPPCAACDVAHRFGKRSSSTHFTRAGLPVTHNLPGRSVPSSHAHVASEAGLRQPRRLVKLKTRVAEGFARRVHNAGFHVGQTVRKDE